MVVEMLTFDVPVDRVDAWLEADAAVWTTFLSAQPGFVRKEVWRGDQDGSIRAVIWWDTLESWKSITPATVDEVDRQMSAAFGEKSPGPTMQSFTTLA